MSFGGGGGFGGFGSSSNTNSNNTFGGFGANNNNNSGFGSNNTNSPFGQSNTGGSLFGGGNNNNTSSPFGGGGGGFGSNTNTSFGSKPFGSTNTGNLFGGASSGSTFGGFGSNNNTTNTSTGFGSNTTNTGLFGQNKTGFNSTGTGTGTLFGGGNTGTGGFGSNNTTGGFGSTSTNAFGAGNTANTNNGTAGTPFTAFQEKDGTAAGGTQHYQTITFQQPYQNFSLEELRVVDYNQGRRYGNQNGQAGAFGQNTGFGGFGNNTNTNTSGGFGANNNSTGLFGGGNTNTTSAFGQNNTTTFGSSNNTTGGGLFGQNKPATGMFGSTSTSQANTGGSIFGGATSNTTGGFGTGGGGFGSNTTNTNTGGGLFGGQNQTQAKPAFGGFGSNNTTNTNPFGGGTTTTGFGQSTNNTGGGLFGQQNQTSSAPAFGSAQTTTTGTGTGLFGGGGGNSLFGGQNNQQNQQKPGLFGASTTTNTATGGGLFGAQNNQTTTQGSSLFGGAANNATGGGLFNNQANQTQQQSGLFGNTANNAAAGGGLFGNKSATTGTNPFGGATANTGTTGGSLFGGLNTQNNQQPAAGSSLFGNQNQQKPGGLFGTSTTNTTGGGLFGSMNQNNNNQALGNSMFSNSNQQGQQPANNSLFGASGGSLLQTSINTNPYGNDNLFAGLATPTQSPGPLATPLSSSQKNRKSAVLPQHKINPSASTRLLTPQNKRIGGGGFGFSYSTYGTPNSASSQISPGYSNGFLGNSVSRTLGKSLSTSNLRNSFTPETSILAPGAFSGNGRPYAGGSLKRLNINRSINRVPLFDEPSSDKKRVTFEPNGTNGTATNGVTGTEIVVHPDSERSSGEPTPSNSSATVNGTTDHISNGTPEMEEVNGKALTTVPENRTLPPRTQSAQPAPVADPKPGEYWSKPSMTELRRMNRDQLSRVEDFTIGRHQIGQIVFNPGKTVDLSAVDLDKLFGDIVQLNTRNATVYGETTTVPKPARGSGLNHFSRITLANSWPRNRVGKKDVKHLERLKRVGGTTFEDYRPSTGEWVFTVPHFSSYGLDYDGDLYSSDEDDGTSPLSAVPDTPVQPSSERMTATPQNDSPASFTQSSPDDTFDFKKGKRSRASVPGGFGDEVPYEEDDEDDVDATMDSTSESFLGERSVGSLDGQQDADYVEESESESVEDQDMAGSFSVPVHTTEPVPAKQSDPFKDSVMPKSILKNSQILRPTLGTPSKGPLVFDDDWASQLQRTISPKKQDRQALRQNQGEVLREQDENTLKLSQSAKQSIIPTHMELLGGLWEGTDKFGSKRGGHGIELPYSKRPKTSRDLDELSADDRDFHSCNKPHFNGSGSLVYAAKGSTSLEDNIFPTILEPIVGATLDIRATKLPSFPDSVTDTLKLQKERTKVTLLDNVPYARLSTANAPLDFAELAQAMITDSPASSHEHKAWQLLSILFDEDDRQPTDMTPEVFKEHREQFRKEKLSDFWQSIVFTDAERHAQEANSAEEKAIAYLSGHNVPDACHALLTGYDLRLATMVAQIGGDQVTRATMSTQIDEWRRLDVLSDMDDTVRALYELVSGNCAQSKGKIGGGRENKLAALSIAKHFNLDWRRAFGLRLWYGILADEPIELAVAQYADALRDGLEEVKPVPWFVEQDAPMTWNDKDAADREDILWGILKLYASSKLELAANIEDVLAPQNVSGHPLNARFSFQLFQLFKSRHDDVDEWTDRRVSMPTDRLVDGVRSSFMSSIASVNEKDTQAKDPLTEVSDQLTLTYASSLHTPEHWTTAIFVYCHLSSSPMREHYIRSMLNQYSNTYAVAETDSTYRYLVDELCLSPQWIHAAAALQAKIKGDGVQQASHLIKAGELEEAHEVVCRSVGPESIISRDYDSLRELLGEFVPTPPSSPIDDNMSMSTRGRASYQKEPVQGWARGGQLYFDYIHLLDLTSNQSSYRIDEELNAEIGALLTKLCRSLEGVARDHWEGSGLEERVALTEIGGVVAGLIAKNQPTQRERILKLPLTEDLWLKHSTDLSVSYYRNVISAAVGR
ncbi:hypothetical protein BU24DRAFT_456721 [Aaosphaeria arxii CBS 175.79]|uniref:Peptidase S59 domain-containing protein n=1 Tax=Aaosphaeria arxii CBS 175.79 TaxID=1450172 RepID=A0A6A5Y640_9PLEO|nr:uncharacterized protein BU24DRAFT_456721 [Aaosphaeria arxii CBS 175.79]KAF2020673.1 hypothetical protein BU24DRAFT_456721 [Aaosphaeria arxii CBS 175.79]